MKRTSALGKIFTVVKWVFLISLLAAALLPFVWLLISSLRTNLELETNPFGLPKTPQWGNYANALQMASLFRLLINSLVVAAATVALNVFITALASYVLSREEFRGRNALHTALTAGVLIPVIAFMVPYFTLITRIGLYNNLLALILVYTAINIPVSIFLETGFMRTLPREIEEAAIIDGCDFYKRFFYMIFPMSKSGLVTAGTFCFTYAWNEFTMAMLLTSSVESRTVQLGIRFFTSQFITDYGGMYAAIVVTIIPSVVIYAILHDQIIGGITAGSVKG